MTNSTNIFNLDDLAYVAITALMLPMLTFLLLFFFGNRLPRKGDAFAVGFMALSFLMALYLAYRLWFGNEEDDGRLYILPWFSLQGLDGLIQFTVSIYLGKFSTLMLVVVTMVSLLIHVYSIEYMKERRNYTRYFPYLGLFTSSMIGIILSDNLLVTFVFWELVGVSSYLLIGFWFEKESAARAGKKAFLMNRIGDAGFLVGIMALYASFGTTELGVMMVECYFQSIDLNTLLFTVAGIGLFMGCVGKSAQFPLQLWLPDAMEGPTPVSALLHAATMVAAGVYLLTKVFFLLNDTVLTTIAFIGAITAVAGALPAMVQHDIKKVLAYSTISQLGYMVMAMGVSAYDAAAFHLITHVFFKACLFLSVGAVIHSMHHMKHKLFIKGNFQDFDTLDMRLMGGFRKQMPMTFYAYFISCMALIGVPFFSGFLSKEAILTGSLQWAEYMSNSTGYLIYYLVPVMALMTVFVTALYMMRQMMLVFFGDFKLSNVIVESKEMFNHVKDHGWKMTAPLIILSVCSLWFVFSPSPFNYHESWFMQSFQTVDLSNTFSSGNVFILSVFLSLSGIAFGYYVYRSKQHDDIRETISIYDLRDTFVYQLLLNNWYMDGLYTKYIVPAGMRLSTFVMVMDTKVIDGAIHFTAYANVVFALVVAWIDRVVVDGIVNLMADFASSLGRFVSSFQSGKLQGYYIYTLISIIVLTIIISILI